MNYYSAIVFCVTVLASGAFAALGWYNYHGEYGNYKNYWAQERASGFGFKVVTNDKGDFVVFDEEFVLGECTFKDAPLPNCASVNRKQ